MLTVYNHKHATSAITQGIYMPNDSPPPTLLERFQRKAGNNVVIASLVVVSAVLSAIFAVISGIKSTWDWYCVRAACVSAVDKKKNALLLERADTLGDAVGDYLGWMTINRKYNLWPGKKIDSPADTPSPLVDVAVWRQQIEAEQLAKDGVTTSYVAIGLRREDIDTYEWVLHDLGYGITNTPAVQQIRSALRITYPDSDASTRFYFRAATIGCYRILDGNGLLPTYGRDDWRPAYESYVKDKLGHESSNGLPCLTMTQLQEQMKVASPPKGKQKD